MKLFSDSFSNNDPIPGKYAFCIPDASEHVSFSDNLNPHLRWTELPANTQSLALICCDPDAPTVADDVNKEDREVPADLPRANFYHWALVDIPTTLTEIKEGEFSREVTAKGKSDAAGPHGTRQGVNNYTQWFAGDDAMAGIYLGYDGPCPPWNDSIPHRYVFTLYALDIARCPVGDEFTAPEVEAAIKGHVLAQASLTGVYALNPRLTE